MTLPRVRTTHTSCLAALTGTFLLPGVALAQPPAPAPLPPATVSAPGGEQPLVPLTPAPAPVDILATGAGGLTSEEVGRRAASTSYTVVQGEETLKAAAARVDQAWQGFLPKLRVSALMDLVDLTNPPALGTVVISKAGTGPVTNAQLAAGQLASVPLALPGTIGAYTLQATISIPISDYFLKLGQNHAAATEARDAAHYDLLSQKATSHANGRVAFYTWLRARGAAKVAQDAVSDQKTHLALAENQYAVGRASRADVLRAQTDVASAELALEQAKNLADLSEVRVRVAIHAKPGESLVPGENLDVAPPPVQGMLRSLVDEAIGRRADIKSLTSNAASLREQAKATRNAGYPSLSASGNAIAANADEGALGPSSQWIGVWYVGASLSWSPNETGTQASAGADASHRAAAVDAQIAQLRDSIEIEVTEDYQNVHQADFSIATAMRELASADEAYRVAKQLFDNGRATSSELTDAETELTRARLDLLNARANARTSRVQLEHALGRDLGG